MNLDALREKSVKLYLVDDETIRCRGPEGVLTASYVEEIRRHKADLLQELKKADSLCDLPFPIGYGGLPENEVVAALGFQDARGITDPIERKLNVLMWLMSGMVWDGDTGELYQRIKGEYHRLRHSDPTIADPCGICECGDGDGKSA
jgi:hypothetical protein